MLLIIPICLVPLVLGIMLGNRLAKRGLTAENALEKHQKTVYFIVIPVTIAIGLGLILGKLELTGWVPLFILLHLGEHFDSLVLAIGWFGVGLLLGLEWRGRTELKRLQQLILTIVVMTVPLCFLMSYWLPVSVSSPLIMDGIVLQTTTYTCAPASIATLAKWTKIAPDATEKEAATIAGTNRFGTGGLAEMRAMRRLGLKPEYRRDLTVNDLVILNHPALLHVKALIGGERIGHAIALLAIDPVEKTFTIGDPLDGIHVKSFEELEPAAGYWTGEAVLVKASAFPIAP
ncbi:papain-like cysteine protease family protein [Lyngbya sp. CCY1209]|uniref:papain-like cysteine protease family protein n=1 Tax=Lyngbya sp. CCY1209 TaxID=2886103 RepID=UPI002D2099FE|nr:papain-like cysteine protease family protein [Lyngbya sp. CCY1209]MEB3886171.1 hypothetical protein [Lyngbya sp. CCY1209]